MWNINSPRCLKEMVTPYMSVCLLHTHTYLHLSFKYLSVSVGLCLEVDCISSEIMVVMQADPVFVSIRSIVAWSLVSTCKLMACCLLCYHVRPIKEEQQQSVLYYSFCQVMPCWYAFTCISIIKTSLSFGTYWVDHKNLENIYS